MCIDKIGLLTEFRFGNIGILTEMQFLKFFVLSVAIGLYNLSYKEAFERNTVIGKIGLQLCVQRFGECGQMLVNLENADGIVLHILRHICLNARHKKCAEERYQLLLTEEILCTDQLQQ